MKIINQVRLKEFLQYVAEKSGQSEVYEADFINGVRAASQALAEGMLIMRIPSCDITKTFDPGWHDFKLEGDNLIELSELDDEN